MTNELFVDGICELDDKAIQSYFSKFGSRIINYESHRHRPTNSCCFALISFESHHTVNAILRHRPHSIDFYSLFVKRLLPPALCSFIERLLPVSSIFVYNKLTKEFDEKKLKTYFKNFGYILKFEHDHVHKRLLIEYDDYDSVDKIFLNKENLPRNIDIHKNILPYAQNTIQYHGMCRRKQEDDITIDEKKKKRNKKKQYHTDDEYQNLLQKTIENLINCKAQLRNKENDCVILQMEHEITISRLQQTLIKLNEQYDIIKSQYQRLLSRQYTSIGISEPKYDILTPHRQYFLSTRLNNNRNFKNEAPDNCLSQFNLSTLGSCDIVMQQQNSPMPIIRSPIQQYQTTDKYSYTKK
ncbi:unnamed protein product [Rotaria sp. Silwood1]|nr:unnamed protein product [Rotaria sp. Silwood1]CAF4826923.1 unnamed protein product [Rotaria sp. Silwood1]